MRAALNDSKMVVLSDLSTNKKFVAPDATRKGKVKNRLQWIKFQKRKNEIARAKEVLGVSTSAEVGEKAFEYFYDHECRD